MDAAAKNGDMICLSCSDYSPISSAVCLERNKASLKMLLMYLRPDTLEDPITPEEYIEAMPLRSACRSLSTLETLVLHGYACGNGASILDTMVDRQTLKMLHISVRGQLEADGSQFVQKLQRLLHSSTPLENLWCRCVPDDDDNVPPGNKVVPVVSDRAVKGV